MPQKFRIACHLIPWQGEQNENLEKVLGEVRDAGYEGVEGLSADSPERLVEIAKIAATFGLHIINIGGPSPEEKIDYNIALGNDAAEVPGCGRGNFGGPDPTEQDFINAARTLDDITAYAVKHNIKPFHHAHRGTMIETAEDADMMLKHAPNLTLLLDTGHILACGSDPMKAIKNHGDRIGHVHLKDFWAVDPKRWDNRKSKWWDEGRFAELGKGNMGMNIAEVMKALEDASYDGWISVELDRAERAVPVAAKANRDYLKSLGY